MSVDLKAGIVRILKPDGTTAGTGFVVNDEGLIATCAHVVEYAEAEPGGTVRVVFHVTDEERQATAEPDWWRSADAEDVAILRLEGPLPKRVAPLPLGSSAQAEEDMFSTFGFPDAKPVEGMAGKCEVIGRTRQSGFPVLQLRSSEVARGFSGAPVWDETLHVVIGMAVSIVHPDRNGRMTETAFIIPVETLREVCPDLLRLLDLSPYRGLQVFEAEHARYYFGREAATQELLAMLSRQDFVTVVGVSGSGKSSLVRAGLEKGLREWPVPGLAEPARCLFTPGSTPLLNLVLALAHLPGQVPEAVAWSFDLQPEALTEEGEARRQANEILNTRSPQALAGALRAHFQSGGLLLIVDQFERLYTDCQDQYVRRRFVETLLAAAHDKVKVLLALRADFYGFALEHPGLAGAINRGQVTLLPMSREELRQAILEPARTLRRTFQPGLADRLAADVRGRAGDLPLLEFALTELWERDARRGVLTLAGYEGLGYTTADGRRFPGVQGAISQRAEAVWQALNQEERKVTRRVFLGLVTPGPVDEREKQTAEDTSRRAWQAEWDEPAQKVVEKLVAARLLTTGQDPFSGQPTVEVAHEALIRAWPRLQQWVTHFRPFARWYDHDLAPFLRRWLESEEDPSYLLPASLLEQARYWLVEYSAELSGPPAEYIRASAESRERERIARERMRLRAILVLAAGLVITLTLALFARIQWRRAAEQRQMALSRQLAAQALLVADGQYDLALLLSLQAYHIADTTEAKGALLNVLEHNPQLTTFLQHPYHSRYLSYVAFSPDGQTLASTTCVDAAGATCNTSEIRLWSMTTGQLISRPFKTTGYLGGVAFSPDSQTLALIRSSPDKNDVALWDIGTGEFSGSPLDHNAADLAFSPDGQLLASCGFDNRIILWDASTGRQLGQPLIGHASYVLSVTFSPDGRTLASGSRDGVIILWDVDTGQLVGPPLIGHFNAVQFLAFSPDGKMLASGSMDANFILWDVATRKSIFRQKLMDVTPWVAAGEEFATNVVVAFRADSRALAVAFLNTITLWDVVTKRPLGQPLAGHTSAVWSLAFSPDGRTLASADMEDTIILWDVSAQRRVGRQLPISHSDWVRSLAFSPDGQTLASGSWDETIILWDLMTGQAIGQPFTGHSAELWSVSFSPDGQKLASGSSDNTVILWDVATGQPVHQPLTGHAELVRSVAFRPDGAMLASGSWDKTIILWDPTTGELLKQLSEDIRLDSLAFSPDNKSLASSGSISSIRLWDIATGRCVDELLAGNIAFLSPLSLAFSPDSATLAGSGMFGIALWDVESGQLIGRAIMESNAAVTSIAFSPDGKVLASTACTRQGPPHCLEGDIRLWDVGTLKPLGRVPPSNVGAVNFLAFSLDGQTLASNSSDNGIILWDLSFASWQARACRIANRNLTMNEWTRFVGSDIPYKRTCPDLPSGEGAPPDAPAAPKPTTTIGPTAALQGAVTQEWVTATPFLTFDQTPTPLQQPTIAAATWHSEVSNMPDGLSLVFPAIIQCRESGDSDQLMQEYVGIWAVHVDRNHEWISEGRAEVILETDAGIQVQRYDVDFSLAANETGLLISKKNRDGYVMSGSESVTNVLKLSVRDVKWEPVGEMANQYRYEVELESHGVYGNSAYPQHVAVFRVHNLSDLTMRDVHFWGAVQNQQGDTVDILHQSGPLDLAPDRTGAFVLRSRSISGRCVGPADSEGYTLHYWLAFRTEDGQQVTRYSKTTLTGSQE